jgi:hypothetical protein
MVRVRTVEVHLEKEISGNLWLLLLVGHHDMMLYCIFRLVIVHMALV